MSCRRKSSGDLLLLAFRPLLNSFNFYRFLELKRPISQKSRKSCFEAICVVGNSLIMEQLNPDMKFLKVNIIPVNKDPILIPTQDKLLVLEGSWKLLHRTFKFNFSCSFKYKAGIRMGDPSLSINVERYSLSLPSSVK
jgi:hypothetical protein